MKVKGITDECFSDYKMPAFYIAFPKCSFKCDKDCGRAVCQNSRLAHSSDIEVSMEELVKRYVNNPITKAVVCGGLEPFDTTADLIGLIKTFRQKTNDPIVVYTGYTETEIYDIIVILQKMFTNIIIKFGRFVPGCESHYDEILGVQLASPNQYAIKIC